MAVGKYKRGIFIGRFQPLHKGHMKVIEFALQNCEELIVCIGSSDKLGTHDNPLDLSTRMKMIEASVIEIGADRIKLSSVPDVPTDEEWFDYIKNNHQLIDVVFSGNDWVKRIFESNNITVIEPPLHARGEFSATNIRKLIGDEEEWKDLLPQGAAIILEQEIQKGKFKSKRKQ